MTRDIREPSVVRLSLRDWMGIFACVVAIAFPVVAAYREHDRMITEMIVRQQLIESQINRIEDCLDKLENNL